MSADLLGLLPLLQQGGVNAAGGGIAPGSGIGAALQGLQGVQGLPQDEAAEPLGFGQRLDQSVRGFFQDPLLGIAAGLLSAAHSQRPMSVGEGLAQGLQLASGLEQAQLENQATRQALSDRQRQREALARLREGVSGEQGLSESELVSNLLEAAPEAAAQGLLAQVFPQERREPSVIQTLRAVGVDPRSEEGRELALESIRSQGSDDLLRTVQTQLAALQLEDKKAEREQEETTLEKQRVGLRQGIRRNLGDVQELARLNRELQGTFLEAGLPLSDLRRTTAGALNAALAAAGADRDKQQEQLAKFDKFRKGLNDLIINTIDRFGGQITNQQLQLLQNASASPDISPAAVASILANVAEINLDTAAREGVPVDDVDRIRSFIARERSFGAEGEAEARPESPRQAQGPPALPSRPTPSLLRRRPELDVQLDAEGNHFLVNTQTGEERAIGPREMRALGLLRGER